MFHVLFLYRIDLAKPDQPNQIELGRKDESKVHKLFLDPTGEKRHNDHSDYHLKTLLICHNKTTKLKIVCFDYTSCEYVLYHMIISRFASGF